MHRKGLLRVGQLSQRLFRNQGFVLPPSAPRSITSVSGILKKVANLATGCAIVIVAILGVHSNLVVIASVWV